LAFLSLKGSYIFCGYRSTIFSLYQSPTIDVDLVNSVQNSTSTRAPTAQATAACIRQYL
jgi:hypothetical protein